MYTFIRNLWFRTSRCLNDKHSHMGSFTLARITVRMWACTEESFSPCDWILCTRFSVHSLWTSFVHSVNFHWILVYIVDSQFLDAFSTKQPLEVSKKALLKGILAEYNVVQPRKPKPPCIDGGSQASILSSLNVSICLLVVFITPELWGELMSVCTEKCVVWLQYLT